MFWMPSMWLMPQHYALPSFSAPSIQEELPAEQPLENPQEPAIEQEPSWNITKKQAFWKYFRKLLRRKYTRPQKKAWTKDDDQSLIKFWRDGLSWEDIAEKLLISNPINCERRFKRLEKLQKKWPERIDDLIRETVEKRNLKWIDIAKLVESEMDNVFSYTGKMVRQRYKNYLRPGIEKKQWTIQDDIKLMKLVFKHGTIWSRFTEQMEGRSELELKNRYHGILEPMRKRVLRTVNDRLKRERTLQRNANNDQ